MPSPKSTAPGPSKANNNTDTTPYPGANSDLRDHLVFRPMRFTQPSHYGDLWHLLERSVVHVVEDEERLLRMSNERSS